MITLTLLMVVTSVFMYMSHTMHFLSNLIMLEYSVVGLFMSIILILSTMHSDMFFMMVFLCTSVCTGTLGVSLLIKSIRHHGSDMISSLPNQW